MAAKNAGKTWHPDEQSQLMSAFYAMLAEGVEAAEVISRLASAHGRTKNAIAARLAHIGILVDVGRGGYHIISMKPWLTYQDMA